MRRIETISEFFIGSRKPNKECDMIEIMIRVFCGFSKTEYTLGYSIVKSFLEALGSRIQ